MLMSLGLTATYSVNMRKRGEKVHERIIGRKFQRTSIVAGKMNDKLIAPLQYSGTMHGAFFEAWFEEHLLPAVPKDTAIILDNASFHRKKRLFEIAERHGRRLIFLPPYPCCFSSVVSIFPHKVGIAAKDFLQLPHLRHSLVFLPQRLHFLLPSQTS